SLTIGGSGAFGTLAFAPGGNTLGTLTVNRTGSPGTVSLNSALTIASTLNLNQGDFNNISGLTLDHDATLTRNANAQLLGAPVLTAAGEFYNVSYVGAAMSTGVELPSTADNNLNDLTINTTGTVTLTKSINVHGDVNLLNSTFDPNGFNITLSGQPGVWNRQSGAFAPGSSTVTVTGNISITAASTPQF